MAEFESIAVPFITVGNYSALTDEQILKMPWLRDFIERFPNCFEYDECARAHYFWPEGKDNG